MNPDDLRSIIQSTLTPLAIYSAAAEELLMATCAQESHLGQYRRQINGPALGIFQMEPGDFDDIFANFLAFKPALRDEVMALSTVQPPQATELVNNDPFAIAMCRVHYMRAPRPLPAATDLEGLWMYYKVNYNSLQGAATQAQFYSNYHRLVGGSAQ